MIFFKGNGGLLLHGSVCEQVNFTSTAVYIYVQMQDRIFFRYPVAQLAKLTVVYFVTFFLFIMFAVINNFRLKFHPNFGQPSFAFGQVKVPKGK